MKRESFIVNYVDKRFDYIHNGHRGFVIGGGPSISDWINKGFDLSLFNSEITIGCNLAYKLFIPKYLVFGDDYFWTKFGDEVRGLPTTFFVSDQVVKRKSILEDKFFALKVLSGVEGSKKTPQSLTDDFPMWINSGIFALRILALMGCNPIYLLGIDLITKNDDGKSHFHEIYDPVRVAKTGESRIEKFYKVFERTLSELKEYGTKVYSCSSISKLNKIIEYVDLLDIWGFNEKSNKVS